MRKRISKALRRGRMFLPTIKTLERDGLQLRIEQYTKYCGHPGYLIELAICSDGKEEWMPIAVIGGEDIHAAADLLVQAAKHLDRLLAERRAIPVMDD